MDKNINSPLVTIAIPIYNAELYLRDAIQSCINQTYQNWELLLMCDGSTDNSAAIVYEFVKKDNRIKVVDDGRNRGLIYRLNESVKLAKGQYYARMDADDIMYVTRIEEQIKFFSEHHDADVVGTSIMLIDDKNNIVGSGYMEGRVSDFVHPTVMGRVEWFRNNPYCDWAHRAEDFELWSRTSTNSNFYAIGHPLLFYREFGIPTVQKYVQSEITLLKVFPRYREYGKNVSWFLKNTIITIVKIVLYEVFSLFGKTDILVSKRRRNRISPELQLGDKELRISINVNSLDSIQSES